MTEIDLWGNGTTAPYSISSAGELCWHHSVDIAKQGKDVL